MTHGTAAPRRALLLDRDGTLIVDTHYPRDPALVEPIEGAIEALHVLQAELALVIISNQSGIGRGLIRQAEAQAVHDRVIERFARGGVRFTAAYYCPHAPEAGCRCRKPAPGLLLDAAREHGLDLTQSIMLGDKPSDIAAGVAAGCGHVIRFGLDANPGPVSATPAVRCEDWASVLHAVRSIATPSEPR